MGEFLAQSVFFGAAVSLTGYAVGTMMQRKFKLAVLNPLLFSIIFVIALLLFIKVDYEVYNNSAEILSYLLTPTTVCFAIPLYEQYERLKKNVVAIIAGTLAGVLSNLASIWALSAIFKLSHEQYVALLPKSITTAIGVALSGELGGVPTLTIAAIVVTGIFGNLSAKFVCRFFRIREPVAVGLAIGSAAHAIGTVRAREIGEEEGAVSSLSIVICGLLTVVFAPLFARFL